MPIKQADRDLENAAKNVGIAAFEVAAFLAEQAVEKYLKAAWTVLTTPRRAIPMRRDERVESFRRDVLPRLVEQFRPRRVLVFGSRARGDALRDSDLDLMVVSEAFAGVAWLERTVLVDRVVGLPGGVRQEA